MNPTQSHFPAAIRNVKSKFLSVLLLVSLLLGISSSAFADFWVDVNNATARKFLGSRIGPFDTREAAQAYINSANVDRSILSISGSGNSSPAPPTPNYEAERRQQEAVAAEAERQRQAEARRIQAEADKRQADFILMRDETVSLLKDASGGSSLKGLNEYGLKDAGGGSGLKGVNEYGLKDAGDPKVVNAQNVPSGLPKAMDDAIAGAYANAPPGVSGRVRNGFQAVMTHDWKVAKAWFGDALNRDPNNADLKRLVALADYSQSQRPASSPPKTTATSRTPGTSGAMATLDRRLMEGLLKGFHADYLPKHPELGPSAAARVPQTDRRFKPNPDDLQFLFPGLRGLSETEAMDILFGISK